MSHANAAPTPRHRLRVAQLAVDQEVPISEVAARFPCSWPTVKRWADRYRAGEPMLDRSSRPHSSPAKTSAAVTKRVVSLRLRKRLGPVQLASLCQFAPSTAHRVLVRCRLNRLSYCDRATGEPVLHYEHARPGDLVHVDVKKFGQIPDYGGWRFVGRQTGKKNRAATVGKPRSIHHHPKMGHAFVHSVIVDHSRVVYSEVHDDETAVTATVVLANAVAWFAERGVPIRRVLSDNGGCYSASLWHRTCDEPGIIVKKSRLYRPQTNGKVERFHRTLADGWGYTRCNTSEHERRQALPAFIHHYNHYRPHTACGNQPPASRLTNLSGQHI